MGAGVGWSMKMELEVTGFIEYGSGIWGLRPEAGLDYKRASPE